MINIKPPQVARLTFSRCVPDLCNMLSKSVVLYIYINLLLTSIAKIRWVFCVLCTSALPMGFPPDSSAHTDTNIAFPAIIKLPRRVPIPDIPAKFGHNRSINTGGDVERTNWQTDKQTENPNYSMMHWLIA